MMTRVDVLSEVEVSRVIELAREGNRHARRAVEQWRAAVRLPRFSRGRRHHRRAAERAARRALEATR